MSGSALGKGETNDLSLTPLKSFDDNLFLAYG